MRFFYQLLFFLFFSTAYGVDQIIFLFDNGEKNMVASMFEFAEKEDPNGLQNLDFKIVFMGASIDAMNKAPFCHFPEKLIHYKELGIDETIDHTWKRDRKIDPREIEELAEQLHIEKKVWVPVSCSIFEQILCHFQDNTTVDVAVLRDNPNATGDSDYFVVADKIQQLAHKVLVPSEATAVSLKPESQKIVIMGHGPTDEWIEQAKAIDKTKIIKRLKLDEKVPIVVFAGSYGGYYEEAFKLFLDIVPHEDVQVLVVPHPRYKGALEKELCKGLPHKIVAEFQSEPTEYAKTVEAIAIADMVITTDATSTVVFHANALKKPVFLVNERTSFATETVIEKGLITKLSSKEDFLSIIHSPTSSVNAYQILGLPKNGAQLLWDQFKN